MKTETVTEAVELHKMSKEAWVFTTAINNEIRCKLSGMRTFQRMMVIQGVTNYLRYIESALYQENQPK